MADVAEIAKGLTKAQREGLLTNKIQSGFTVRRLIDKGLMEWVKIAPTKSDRVLTPLGLAVRDYLANQSESA